MDEYKELFDAITILIERKMQKCTQVFNGIVTLSSNTNVTVNGKAYKLPVYGGTESAIFNGTVVKVIVPQGDFSQAFILI